MNLQTINLKFLIKAHTKLGLFAVFFFFISAFFGTITLFMPQIKTWEKPSRYFVYEENYNFKLDELIKRTIKEEGFSTQKIDITLPSFRDNVIAINDPASRTKYINPYSLKMLDTTSDNSFLAQFLNELHIGRNIPKIGTYLMGIASLLTLFLLLSGVMLFINKHKTKKTFNFKWHRDISLVLFPYILVFALTGSVLGFMLGSSSPFAYAATQGEKTNMRALVGPILFPKDKIPVQTKEATMLNIDSLKQKAQLAYPNLVIQNISLLQWYDSNAQIKFSGYLKNNRILSGRINRQSISLDGQTGNIIKKIELENSHMGNTFLSAFYFFHFIPDETTLFRIIYAIFGIVFMLSLSFGFLIWSDKKAKKHQDERYYFNFLSRFSVAIMFGVIPATALLLCLYWAVPNELFQRLIWIKGSFYAFWALTLVLSMLFKDIIELLKTLSLFTAMFLIGTLLAHMIKAKTELALLVQSGQMHPALYVDSVILVLAILFFSFYKFANKITFINHYSRRVYVS